MSSLYVVKWYVGIGWLVGWLVECLFEYTYTYPLETVRGYPKVLFISSIPIPGKVARVGPELHYFLCYQCIL